MALLLSDGTYLGGLEGEASAPQKIIGTDLKGILRSLNHDDTQRITGGLRSFRDGLAADRKWAATAALAGKPRPVGLMIDEYVKGSPAMVELATIWGLRQREQSHDCAEAHTLLLAELLRSGHPVAAEMTSSAVIKNMPLLQTQLGDTFADLTIATLLLFEAFAGLSRSSARTLHRRFVYDAPQFLKLLRPFQIKGKKGKGKGGGGEEEDSSESEDEDPNGMVGATSSSSSSSSSSSDDDADASGSGSDDGATAAASSKPSPAAGSVAEDASDASDDDASDASDASDDDDAAGGEGSAARADDEEPAPPGGTDPRALLRARVTLLVVCLLRQGGSEVQRDLLAPGAVASRLFKELPRDGAGPVQAFAACAFLKALLRYCVRSRALQPRLKKELFLGHGALDALGCLYTPRGPAAAAAAEKEKKARLRREAEEKEKEKRKGKKAKKAKKQEDEQEKQAEQEEAEQEDEDSGSGGEMADATPLRADAHALLHALCAQPGTTVFYSATQQQAAAASLAASARVKGCDARTAEAAASAAATAAATAAAVAGGTVGATGGAPPLPAAQVRAQDRKSRHTAHCTLHTAHSDHTTVSFLELLYYEDTCDPRARTD
jgi:hypothetical protein